MLGFKHATFLRKRKQDWMYSQTWFASGQYALSRDTTMFSLLKRKITNFENFDKNRALDRLMDG